MVCTTFTACTTKLRSCGETQRARDSVDGLSYQLSRKVVKVVKVVKSLRSDAVSATAATLIAFLTDCDTAAYDAKLGRILRDGGLSVDALERPDHPCPVTFAPLDEAGFPIGWSWRTVRTCRALFDALARQAKAAGEERSATKEGRHADAFLAVRDRELARSAAQALTEGTTARALLLAAKFHPIGWRGLSRIDRSLSLDNIVLRGLHAAEQAITNPTERSS
jgi:hypothetical protein